MDILQVGKLSYGDACFQLTQVTKAEEETQPGSLSTSSLCYSEVSRGTTNYAACAWRVRGLPPLSAFSTPFYVSKEELWLMPLSAAVSLSLGAEEDAVPGFHSSLLPGGELPQGCRFSPEDRHLQSFSLQRSSLALSFISAYSRETLQLSITLLWRGRVRYRIT